MARGIAEPTLPYSASILGENPRYFDPTRADFHSNQKNLMDKTGDRSTQIRARDEVMAGCGSTKSGRSGCAWAWPDGLITHI
jgi:hypothetical protein